MRSTRLSYIFPVLVLSLLFFSCTETVIPGSNQLDIELKDAIKSTAALVSGKADLGYYILPDPSNLDSIPQDLEKNPLNPAKVELGKFLFYDTGIAVDAKFESGKNTYSCATCHIPEAGFRPGTFQGIADGGVGYGIRGENRRRNQDYQPDDMDVQDARALSLLNVAFVKNTFWNGQFGANDANQGTEALWNEENGAITNELGFLAIESQNIEGVHTHRMDINKDMADEFGYTSLFDEAFPEYPESERYSQTTLALALSAYLRTLMSNEAPFQKWLKGDYSALSFEEKEGALLFFGKANCSTCHYSENLGSNEFHALGVNDMHQIDGFSSSPDDFRNFGRGGFTLLESDMYKFKVPGVYNMKDTPFYFHGSSVRSLEELVDYFNDGVKENPNVPEEAISPKFKPLDLTVEEKAYLVKFLEYSLRDPNLKRYKPETIGSGLCFPNADLQSQVDLGCY